MKSSNNLINQIKQFEGYRSKAYRCWQGARRSCHKEGMGGLEMGVLPIISFIHHLNTI